MANIPPSEFDRIGLDTHRFRPFGNSEWHGPCPFCGGTDRFVIHTDREYPSWNWWCRVCSPDGGWIDEINPMLKEPLTPERRKQIADEAEKKLKETIKEAERVLKDLQKARAWEQYHEQLTDDARATWQSWGIPAWWQDFWKLGFDPDRTIWTGEMEWSTPTMTIPIFESVTWNCLNIKHRLINPPRKGDKYRPERSGLPAALYVAYPDEKLGAKTLLVEGEKKAMVSFITADDPFLQVVGVPGKNPKKELLAQLSECEPIYICLDPDATNESVKLARRLGTDRTRVLELPDKIDDLIIRHHLDKHWIKNIIRQAVKV